MQSYHEALHTMLDCMQEAAPQKPFLPPRQLPGTALLQQAFIELTAWASERHAQGSAIADLFWRARRRGWSGNDAMSALLRALPKALHGQVLECRTRPFNPDNEELCDMLASVAARANEEGHAPAQIFNWLRRDEQCAADDAVALLLRALPAQPPGQIRQLARLAPAPDFSTAAGSRVCVEGHQVQILYESRHPRLVVFGNLLTADECEELIASAQSRLARSRVSRSLKVSPRRTSSGMRFERGETSLCERIEARIAALLDWPCECSERLEVLHYGPGAQYEPHYDHVVGDGPWDPVFQRGGQRVASLIIYLNTPPVGGSTVFPDMPLEVRALTGNAVFFAYPEPAPSSRCAHAGAPVIEGEKWAAVKWFRQGPHS